MAALLVSLKLSDDHVRVFGLDPLPGLADYATRFLDGTVHQGDVPPEAIIMQEHELLAALSFVVCSHRLGLDRGSVPSHRGELGAQSDTAPQIRSWDGQELLRSSLVSGKPLRRAKPQRSGDQYVVVCPAAHLLASGSGPARKVISTHDRDLECDFRKQKGECLDMCSSRATDRDLESVSEKRSESLDMCLSGNRWWSCETHFLMKL